LSTWRQLVDDAAGLAGQPRLAQAAPAPRARLSRATAEALGLGSGDQLAVSTDRGEIVLPLVIEPGMLDDVVHLPAKSPGSWVLASLGASHGSVVKLAPAARPAEAKEVEQ
jgi:NADH-quinone oxidoreductase subunit G